jgi:peroxygenase
VSVMARGSRTARRRSPGRGATSAQGAGRPVPPAPRSAPNSGSRTALQKHVDFFDTNHDGRITLSDTYHGLRRLGLGAARAAAFAGVINVALGSSTSGAPSLTVDTERIHAGKHRSDSGVYDKKGRFSAPRFRRLFARYDADGDGALDSEELARLCADNRTDLVGHLGSKAEFGLLLDIAGEERNGKKALTRGRLQRFYNGSLFYELAEEVAARRASEWATLRGAVSSGLREFY